MPYTVDFKYDIHSTVNAMSLGIVLFYHTNTKPQTISIHPRQIWRQPPLKNTIELTNGNISWEICANISPKWPMEIFPGRSAPITPPLPPHIQKNNLDSNQDNLQNKVSHYSLELADQANMRPHPTLVGNSQTTHTATRGRGQGVETRNTKLSLHKQTKPYRNMGKTQFLCT